MRIKVSQSSTIIYQNCPSELNPMLKTLWNLMTFPSKMTFYLYQHYICLFQLRMDLYLYVANIRFLYPLNIALEGFGYSLGSRQDSAKLTYSVILFQPESRDPASQAGEEVELQPPPGIFCPRKPKLFCVDRWWSHVVGVCWIFSWRCLFVCQNNCEMNECNNPLTTTSTSNLKIPLTMGNINLDQKRVTVSPKKCNEQLWRAFQFYDDHVIWFCWKGPLSSIAIKVSNSRFEKL